MRAAIICVGLLGLLLVGLGLWVSLTRGRTQTLFGYAADPTDPLYKLVRAHGNAAEYAPMLGLLIFVAGTRDPGAWLQATFFAAVVSRWLHAAGMVFCASLDRPHALRAAGAVGTYLTGLVLAIALLV